MYTPQLRPGLRTRRILEEELILVASWRDPTLASVAGQYVMVDWGPEFVQAHAVHMPELTQSGITFSLGAMTADFIRTRQLAAYLPARYVKRYIDDGTLHLVRDAPVFLHPAWAVWREDLDVEVLAAVERAFDRIVVWIEAAHEDVLKNLAGMNEGGEIEILGDLGEFRGG